MHHKRGRPKNRRAGCLMCKSNKVNGGHKHKLGHYGFGPLRARAAADADLRSELSGR